MDRVEKMDGLHPPFNSKNFKEEGLPIYSDPLICIAQFGNARKEGWSM